jgi:hypothetical protein
MGEMPASRLGELAKDFVTATSLTPTLSVDIGGSLIPSRRYASI